VDKETGEKKIRYSREIMKKFGMLIIDEAHHISARKVYFNYYNKKSFVKAFL
jgi:superfamily II DNA or RNA helicase